MRTWRSSVGALVWMQALHLGTILVLVGFALSIRAATATTAPTYPVADPSVDAMPLLVAVTGTVVGTDDGLVGIEEDGGDQPVAFPVGAAAALTRGGDAATLTDLHPGDEVRMTVDGRTGRVLDLAAEPVTTSGGGPSDGLALMAALGLIAGGAVLAARRCGRSLPVTVDGGSGRIIPAPVGRLGLMRERLSLFAPAQRPECRA